MGDHPPHPIEKVEEVRSGEATRKGYSIYYCSECRREFEGTLNDKKTAYLEKGPDIKSIF